MSNEAKNWWELHGPDYQSASAIPIDVLYGPGSPNESVLGLIGSVEGKRVLELGCGGGQASIAFAKQGALVTAVDIAASEIEFAKRLAEENGVGIEFHERDMADLSPIPSLSQDIVFSACAVSYLDDLELCFREVHRVLVHGGLFVLSGGHPFGFVVDSATLTVKRSYADVGKRVEGEETGCAFASVHRTLSDYFNGLVDAGFVVDRLIEPDSRERFDSDPWFDLWDNTAERLRVIPGTFILRSHKVGESQ